ncbi:MAG: membrane dipeptidase [Oscillospiraceae bacterium]|nr:membrane dipeptidase [Oscillospiraceae bacterium]
MNFPVFDLHCDTALALLGEDMNQAGSLRKNDLHIDLERAKELGGYCQCFACFTTPYMEEWHKISPILAFERELATIQREVDKNKDLIGIAYSPRQIEENRAKGKMSAVLTLEGTAGFGYDPELLESLHQIGFRITSLGWNEKNPLTGSHRTGGGLTDRGREYVKEAQRLGMLIDVSHISDEGFWDIMKITNAPVIATHSNSRAVWNSSRNLTDDMFRAIVETGGVAGLNMYAGFIGEEDTADLDQACDHVLHFMELDPSGKHIALGGDLDGCNPLVQGLDGVQGYPRLARRLLERGLDEKTVMDIYWNNAIGVMECAVCNHAK